MNITAETLIARRASKGFAADESRELLSELLSSHDGDNLASALIYQEFATHSQADKFAQAAN